MSRRYGRYTSDSPLRRQHSVNSDPFYQTENNPTTLSVSPGVKTSTSSQSAWNNNFGESQRNMDKGYVHSPTSSRSPKLTVGNPPYREPSSPRYLSVLDQGFSGHSSMVAMSRGSQQPSFESYDSSMSMNSWASSNETDAMNTSAQGQYDPNQYSAQRSGLNLSSSYSGGGAGISPDYPEMINYADDRGSSSKRSDLSIRNTPVSQTREQPNRRKKFGFEALGSSSEAESTTPERSRDNRRKDTQSTGSSAKESRSIKSCLKKLDELKLIGSEMENPSDGKNSDGHGPPNIKGLWKRAFHSLRKDKGKSETDTMRKKEGSSSSVEIDPVYHLLRCAASKSQTTNPVRSTSGRPGEGMKITPAEAQLAMSQGMNVECADKVDLSPEGLGRRARSGSSPFKPLRSDNPLLDIPDKIIGENMRGSDTGLESMTIQVPAISDKLSTGTLNDLSGDIPLEGVASNISILEVAEEDAKSVEARLAYEQHKRTVARRNVMKNAQKSLSFAVDEEPPYDTRTTQAAWKPTLSSTQKECSRSNMDPYDRPEVSGNRLRVPLSSRLKSLSVDDKDDQETNPEYGGAQRRNASNEYIPGSMQRSPIVHGTPMERPDTDERPERRTGRQASRGLLSTKSFSLDVPGSDSLERSPVISGASSPGRATQSYQEQNLRYQQSPMTDSRSSLSPRISRQQDPSFRNAHHRPPNPPFETYRPPHLLPRTPNMFSSRMPEDRRERVYPPYASEYNVASISGRRLTQTNPPYMHPSNSPFQRSRREVKNPNGTIFIVSNDFYARHKDEITLRTGQYVKVLEILNEVWWYGCCEGRAGYFPSAYVRPVMPS